jgi:hypothetical protein
MSTTKNVSPILPYLLPTGTSCANISSSGTTLQIPTSPIIKIKGETNEELEH